MPKRSYRDLGVIPKRVTLVFFPDRWARLQREADRVGRTVPDVIERVVVLAIEHTDECNSISQQVRDALVAVKSGKESE